MSTIIDVARKAGVSPMTVSRYFNQPEMLRPATRERVREAIEQLHYVPNEAARSLVRGRTQTIALILADITNPFFTTLARGVEDAAEQHGYTLILGNTDETLDKEKRYLDIIISRRVDGVLLSPTPGDTSYLNHLHERDIPIVLIDRKVNGIKADIMRADSYAGGRLLVEHLVAQGYRDIAFIGGQGGISSLTERLDGYHDAMAAADLTPRSYLGRYDRASGQRIIAQLVADDALPEALIAANNYVAVGALIVLRQHGLQVPRDVALTSLGDIELAAQIDPFLTVVQLPAYEMGRQAMEMLLERMRGGERPLEERVLPVELVVRRSSPRQIRPAERAR